MVAPRCPGTAAMHSTGSQRCGIWPPLWLRPGFSDPDHKDDSTMEVKEVEEVKVSLEAKFLGATAQADVGGQPPPPGIIILFLRS